MILTKSGRKEIDLERLQLDYISRGDADKLLMVVPTNRKMRQMKKLIIQSSPESFAAEVFVETLSTLSEKLLSQTQNFTLLSEAASAVFIEQSADNSTLRYFSKYQSAIPFGTLDKIKNAISEYKRLGISPRKLRAVAEQLELNEKNKALDIADIFQSYKKRCESISAFEIGDIYEKLNALDEGVIISDFQGLFPAVEIVIVSGFDEFSTPEINILDKLSSSSTLELYLDFDYFAHNKAIFGHLDNCYRQFKFRNFTKVKDISQSPHSAYYEKVRSQLFKLSASGKKINADIQLIPSTTREKEVENIARLIKLLIRKENAAPSEICVAFNNITNYSPLIRSIFPIYGIPINLTDRTKLANTPPIVALINLLEILENDFYFKNILRALNNPFIRVGDFDATVFVRVASKLKITAGWNAWQSKLQSNIKLIESYGSDKLEKNLSLEDLYSVREMLKRFSELHKPFRDEMPPKEFLRNFTALIERLGISELLLRNSGEGQEANIKAFTLFLETVGELMELTGKEKTNTPKPFTDYLEQLKTACGWARFNVKEKSDYGVLVTSVNEIRGLQFDYLFVGGLIDGEFPLHYTPDFFLSGDYRKNEEIRQTEERYHFYQVLSEWKKRLYLTYPKIENKHEQPRSIFISELEKIADLHKLPDDYFEKFLFNKKELFLRGDNNSQANYFVDEQLDTIREAARNDKQRFEDIWSESEFTGFLGGAQENEISEKLAEFCTGEFSISQLETYAKCPFRFFIERVLKIEIDEEPSEEFDYAEIGLIMHAILYEFYIRIGEKNIILKDCSDAVFDSAVELIFNTGEEIFKSAESDYPLAFLVKERVFGFDGDRRDSILYRFLEKERIGDEFHPAYFEAAFGCAANYKSIDKISSTEPAVFNNIKLKGKIDRIELDEENGVFSVADYKLGGKKILKEDLKEGLSLQLPVYLYAAEKLLKNIYSDKFRPASAFIYSLKYSADNFGKHAVKFTSKRKLTVEDKLDTANEQIQASLAKIDEFATAIGEGRFNLTKLEKYEQKACRFCDFGNVCRVAELLK